MGLVRRYWVKSCLWLCLLSKSGKLRVFAIILVGNRPISISISFPFLCFSECVTNLTNSISVTNFIALNFFHMHLLPPLVSLLVNGVYLCWHAYLLV